MALGTGAVVTLGAVSSQAGASQSASKTTKFHITCNLGTLGTYDLAASLTGTYPKSVKSGASFKATSVHGSIIVPARLNSLSHTFGKSYEADLTPINANSTDATPGTINGAGKGIIVKGETGTTQFTLPIPQHGTITVGPWKAGKKGSDKITFGTAGGTDTVYSGPNQTGIKETTVTISCSKPSPPAVLATVSVT
jgi:hypothetical protein